MPPAQEQTNLTWWHHLSAPIWPDTVHNHSGELHHGDGPGEAGGEGEPPRACGEEWDVKGAGGM